MTNKIISYSSLKRIKRGKSGVETDASIHAEMCIFNTLFNGKYK